VQYLVKGFLEIKINYINRIKESK